MATRKTIFLRQFFLFKHAAFFDYTSYAMKNSAFNFGLKHIAYQKPGLALSGARTQAEFEVFL